jgi:CRISPR-associated protein Csx17
MIYKHILKGCQPTPLAHYLKALGILRLVAEQKDPTCRGAWVDDYFVLATRLSQEELEKFFLEEYQPTAIMDPWNGGSGFYQKDNTKAITALLASDEPRLENLRKSLEWAKKVVGQRQEPPSDDEKVLMQMQCQQKQRFSSLDAINAAFTLVPQSKRKSEKAVYPSLLGTGWNDGRLDFANNYHQRIANIFGLLRKPEKNAEKENQSIKKWHQDRLSLLNTALWMNNCESLERIAVGQFFPGCAGGANSTTGPDGDSLVNPWDFVLMLEGAVLFSASATKRLNPMAQVQASAPFSFFNDAVGSSSFSDAEESQRGEQWMPLWSQWTNLAELKALLTEGRAQIGKTYAARPVDMARAVSRLGVSRGIDSFIRYGYLERNGQIHFAVPLGKIIVPNQPCPKSRLVDDLAPWMERLHRKARDKAPSRLVQVERNLADAVFDTLTHDDTPSRWQGVLLAAVEVEKVQACGSGFEVGPIPPLSPEWIAACDNGSAEFRLACALGSAYYQDEKRKQYSIRCHWLPLDEKNPRKYATSEKRLAHDVRVVAQGRNAEQDLIAVFSRRCLESTQHGERHPQICARQGLDACLSDLAAWVNGSIDVERCVSLARAFMSIDWWKWNSGHPAQSSNTDWPEDAWCALKLCALPWALESNKGESAQEIPFDPAILRRLQSGDGEDALRLVLRRLQAHGIHPALEFPLIDADVVRHWASAIAFPISQKTAQKLKQLIQPSNKETSHVH